MNKPIVGLNVHFFPADNDAIARSNNNNGPVAAIITRVWTETCVSLKIVPDCGPMQDRTSIMHQTLNPDGAHWDFIEA